MRGRKSEIKEYCAIQGYKDILPKFFRELNRMLDSEIKSDRLEAMKIAKGGVEKFLPTIVGGDSDNPLQVNVLKYEPNANASASVSTEAVPASSSGSNGQGN